MEKKKRFKDSLVVGLALFATMFGAGNLIFPPQIGLVTGTQWVSGAIGILITGVILPVTAFWAVNNVGTSGRTLMGHVHPKFYSVFYLIACILVGMGSTIPRSAATTHELGVLNIFPNVPIWVTMIVFFALVFFFACDKGSVVDKIGKYLTPLLLIILAIVLIKGIFSPIGSPIDTNPQAPLTSSMLTGYLTGDLTVGLMCSNIFVASIVSKGHTNPSDRKKSGIIVGLVSIVALGIIYVALTYIGATGGSFYDAGTAQTALLSGLVGRIFGHFGLVLMGVVVALACLTTAIGISSMGASIINETTNGKVPYKVMIGIICVVCAVLGTLGVQNIISYVTPIFLIMYPICIIFTLLGLLDRFIPNDGIYKGGILAAGIVSLGDAILSVFPNLEWLNSLMSYVPLFKQGFSWVIPAIIGMIIGGILCRNKPRFYDEAKE